jgi:acyl-CoA dehydrogenase
MDLSLSEEERAVRDWVRTFVTREIIPLEPEVLRRERAGEAGLPADELARLQDKAKLAGFWGVPQGRDATGDSRRGR